MVAKNIKQSSTLEARLSKYGLGTDALNADTLRVSSQTTVRLAATGGGIAPARWLRPNGIAQLKEWIGVPQSVVSQHPGLFNGRRTAKLPPTSLVDAVTKVAGERRGSTCSCKELRAAVPELRTYASEIRGAIRQYLFGDASELAPFEGLLDHSFATAYPFWLFGKVVVEEGGVLEIGAGTNSIVVDTVIIEEGGEIRCEGSLKIDCRRIARA
jgi:hypothetical protein